jgi:putative methyltransferase
MDLGDQYEGGASVDVIDGDSGEGPYLRDDDGRILRDVVGMPVLKSTGRPVSLHGVDEGEGGEEDDEDEEEEEDEEDDSEDDDDSNGGDEDEWGGISDA